jgi:hypothetical protein
MIDHVEAALALRVVDAANVDQATETAIGIVAEEFERGDDVLALDLDGKLAERNLGGEETRPEAIFEISAELVKGVVHRSSGNWGFSARSCRSA